ncbi:serine hydrolase [Nocardia sp. NPDC004711]
MGAVPDPADMGRWLHDCLTPPPRGWTYSAEANFTKGVPGQAHQYSDVAYELAGHVVQAATGKYFADYCRDAILTPAGMTRSDFNRDKLSEDNSIALRWYRRARASHSRAANRTAMVALWMRAEPVRGPGQLRGHLALVAVRGRAGRAIRTAMPLEGSATADVQAGRLLTRSASRACACAVPGDRRG